ncbi:MAG: HNH endonuclease [Armatimonadota bacterium]
MRNPAWVRDELILALDLYNQITIAELMKMNPADPRIIILSQVLKSLPIHPERLVAGDFRNPNGVYMKLCNFLRLDPDYQGKGLAAGSKADEEVWNEFRGDIARLRRVAEAIRERVENIDEYSAYLRAQEMNTSIGEDYEVPEGRVLFREHRVRERNANLVNKKKAFAIQQGGVLRCEVCSFVFGEYYGGIGEGFIECHHNKPVSQLIGGDKTRLDDLSLVCSNCHRMLHVGGELLTVNELRSKLLRSYSDP